MTLRITEVFFGPYTHKREQQWFEVLNDGDEPVNLAKAVIKRLDGQKKQKKAWEANLTEQDFILEPQQTVVIAQKADLGQNLCSDRRVIVLKDLKLEPSGVQRLCIDESCVKINDLLLRQKNIESGWTTCPEPVQEVKTIEHQSARHAGGCQMVSGGGAFELWGLLILALVYRPANPAPSSRRSPSGHGR